MRVKCLVCGKSYKILNQTHLKTHGLTRQQYLNKFPNSIPKASYNWRSVTKECVDCGRLFFTKMVHKHVIRCRKCQSKRRRIRKRHTQRLYMKKRRLTFGFHDDEFGHSYDPSVDLTIENGRVKGALWLEKNRNAKKTCALCGLPKIGFCDAFIVIDDNHVAHCPECGGKIVKAPENEIYSIVEYACASCGLVLEA